MDEVAAVGETTKSQQKHSLFASAWPQLVIGVVCMVMIANLQYGWTFFVPDIQKQFGWDRSAIQIAFTLFVLFETWLVPIEGWFVDRFGPQIVVFIGGLACAFGWSMNSYATSLGQFYFAQIITGIGAGAVYGTCIGNALKWFPSRRGIAAGLTAAGFGAGSALTVIPIQAMIKSEGFQNTFLYFGLGQGVVICLFAFAMVAPRAGQLGAAVVKHAAFHSLREISGREIIGANRPWIIAALVALAGGLAMWSMGLNFYIPLALAAYIFTVGGSIVWSQGQPIFTLMYFMFVIVGAGGLIVTANLAPISLDLKVGTVPVTLAWLTLPALTFAATLDRTLNGLTRPFFGCNDEPACSDDHEHEVHQRKDGLPLAPDDASADSENVRGQRQRNIEIEAHGPHGEPSGQCHQGGDDPRPVGANDLPAGDFPETLWNPHV